MPRPTDIYTHAQFERVESANSGETVRCIHCHRWQGSSKVLNRKKAHLQACPQYAEWRAAGNGQELALPNPYSATARADFNSLYDTDCSSSHESTHGPATRRQRSNIDLSKYFDEFFDESLGQKCARVRCKSCGFVRAKNATRQAEHLTQCKEFRNTSSGSDLLARGDVNTSEPQREKLANGNSARPNASLLDTIEISHQPLNGNIPNGMGPRPFLSSVPYAARSTSLTDHLLLQAGQSLIESTHNVFLHHAGCGILTKKALTQWLGQMGYISRTLVSFTGALIGKIRIPEVVDLELDPTYRCVDLLCSAVNNMKKELEFFEATKCKYALNVGVDGPQPSTKGLIDLFISASSPSATLLEGMVVLWAVETLFYNSFSYAGSFVDRTQPMLGEYPYSISSWFSSRSPAAACNQQSQYDDGHITALRETFIENWQSDNFCRFVEACKATVDDLALAQTTGSGKAEMLACEYAFGRAVFLWGKMFPQVTAMVEPDGLADGQNGNRPANVMDEIAPLGKHVDTGDEGNGETHTDSPPASPVDDER